MSVQTEIFRIVAFISILFFSLDAIGADSFHRAEDLFKEHLFSDAISHYEQALSSENSEDKDSWIHQRLAECYLELGEPQKALVYLQRLADANPYLLAVAFRQQKQHQKAIDLLHNAFPSSEVSFELALNYFYLGDQKRAKVAFNAAKEGACSENLSSLAQLYLARIALGQKEMDQAKHLLHQLTVDEKSDLALKKYYWLGVCAFQEKNYTEAIRLFNNSLSDSRPSTLRFLAWSHLKLAESQSREPQLSSLLGAEGIFDILWLQTQDESALVDLGEFYRIKGSLLHDLKSDERIKEIGNELENSNPAEAFYLRGLRALDQGLYAQQSTSADQAQALFEESAVAFQNAQESFIVMNHPKAPLAIQYQALAHYHQNTPTSKAQAFTLLDRLIHKQPELLALMQEPQEIYYMQALMCIDMPEQLEAILHEGLHSAPKGKYADLLTKMLGLHYMQMDRKQEAEAVFKDFIEQFPNSDYLAEVWFWRGQCTLNDEEKRQYFTEVFQHYPGSFYAPQAYFEYYSYREYAKGQRQPIKHLKAMPTLFPDSPLLMNAYYLIGLDHKKDRISDEGKVVQRKNWLAAIDAFQQAELVFERLYPESETDHQKQRDKDLPYYTQLYYKARLEKALANLAVAQESQASKKLIYLNYAEGVFANIVKDLKDSQNALTHLLANDGISDNLLDEAEFGLAKTYLCLEHYSQADEILSHLIARHQDSRMPSSYHYARALYEKAMLSSAQFQIKQALEYLLLAEKHAKGFSTEEKLDLWIQQSLCYSALGQLSEAMSLLSKVINEDAISGLRVKAMFLRAEVYEKQERPELAMKQLKATSKKGGEWGQKAKEKLEHDYEYQ